MSAAKTYTVTYRTEACTLVGDVTACSRAQAIEGARAAWGAAGLGGNWTAHQLPAQVSAELMARHADMDETAGACHA